MIYAFNITVPANTLTTAPLKQALDLIFGKITTVEIRFQAGCKGMVKVKLFQGNSTIAPINDEGYIIGDDETVPLELDYILKSSKQITFNASSQATTYDHIITVRINVQTEEEAITSDDILTVVQEIAEVITPPDEESA
jgi:hypothetical protein